MGQDTKIKVAFVSTNSIAQGEQVGILWKELFENYSIKIHYAHQTFNWSNEARGNAAVHVVIIGFGNFNIDHKRIYEYEDIKDNAHEKSVKNINPYLVEGDDIVVEKRSIPISDVNPIKYGSIAIDNGFLILTDEEKLDLISMEPIAEKYIYTYGGGAEFIKKIKRWCLWLEHLSPNDLRLMPLVKNRIEKVKEFRKSSNREATKKLAEYPTLFGEIRQPKNSYILIPKVSSETRQYIPMGFMEPTHIANGSSMVIENATLYEFGVLESILHMTWIKYTCGRMKSDYQYSNTIVYNNYPFPKNISDKNKTTVEEKAQNILGIRASFPDSSLADLYDPLAMPPKLKKAHQELDRAVDKCYTKRTFKSDKERIEFLFGLYEEYVSEAP